MKTLNALLLSMALLPPAGAAGSKLKVQDLPAAVQKSVREQTQNATVGAISKEVESGKTRYEVETKVNGKSRDIVLDSKGAVIQTEDEVEIGSIPAAAKAAIDKQSAGGSIQKVEKLTMGSSISYEAAIKTKAGKSAEIGVNADGSPHKN